MGEVFDIETAERIWDLLVRVGGTYPDPWPDFVRRAIEPPGITEYRFCGHLGFGGKFWADGGRWYVTCYPEDETPERLAIMGRLNEELSGPRGGTGA